MNIVSIQGLTKSHGIKQLFTNVTMGIEDRDRIGIIGPNGCGKSTLLSILAGVETADAGIIARKQGLKVEFLGQKPLFDEHLTVLEALLQGDGEAVTLVREFERVSARLESTPDDAALLKRMEDISHQMDMAGAWEIESTARIVLSRLGIRDLEARVDSLSGGYRKRVSLARALLSPCDMLILDEPTNHLDTEMIAWLEDYLRTFAGAVVLVTHDRYFLDRITKVIFDIERGELRRFEGNFSYYLERKAEIESALDAADQRRSTILRRELAWLKRGARARTTKAKARIKGYFDLKAEEVDRTVETVSFQTGTRRLGNKILILEDVSKSMGGKVCVKDLSYAMPPGERLGIIGPNGCGKSTLVNLITGILPPDSGKIEIGETVYFGYYDQESKGLDPNERALEYVKREGGEMLRAANGSYMNASAVMEQFLFTQQMLYQPIGKLSGGEQRRLYLVKTLMRDPNFLILDEPTNDLDIATLQALENYLEGFAGCLIVISHDRYFLDRTVNCVMAYEGDGEWKKYPGGYDAYATMKAERASEANQQRKSDAKAKAQEPVTVAAVAPPPPTEKAPARLSYKEQKELATLETEIAKGEAKLSKLANEIAGAASDFTRLQPLLAQQKEVSEKLEGTMARWEALATKATQAAK